MTQGQVKKHIKEMRRWADAPDGTKVWHKMKATDSWALDGDPAWLRDILYIVDDEWAELRKAQTDGKQLQIYQNLMGWVDGRLTYADLRTSTPEHWRIKLEATEKLKR